VRPLWRDRLGRTLRALLREVVHSDRVPAGLAMGVFFGFIAPPGVQTAVAVAVAALLRTSPLGAAVGVWVTNPLSIPFIYADSLNTGEFLTGLETAQLVPAEDERFWAFITNFRTHGRTIILLWTGLLFNGAIATIVTLYTFRGFAAIYRRIRVRQEQGVADG
jgi:hypothetical protein